MTPDRGPTSAPRHESDQGHGPASISGREVAVLESAREDPPPGPGRTLERSWVIEVPFAGRWLTANRSGHYRYAATDWRNSAMVACINAKLPKGITPVRLHLVCWYASSWAPVRDSLNLSPTVKAIIDGLTPTVTRHRNGRPHTRGGYGLLPDDSDKHIVGLPTWEVVKGPRPKVDLYITEVTAEPAVPQGGNGAAFTQQ